MSNRTPPGKENTGQNTPAEERKKLPEEIKFDKAAYGGISYFSQAFTGVLLSRSIKHGALNKPFRQFTEWVTRKPAKEPSTTLIITAMIMVGNTFLLPLRWLENRKPRIVRWMVERKNAKNPPSPEEKAEQEKALQQLEREPQQNWWSLLGGRGFGLAVVYLVDHLIGEKRNAWLQNKSSHYIQKGFGTVGLKKMAQSEIVGQYLKIGFVDSFYSAVSAGGLYIYSHFIRPPKKHKTSPELSAVTSAGTPPSASEVPPEKQFTVQHPSKTTKSWQAGVNSADKESGAALSFPA